MLIPMADVPRWYAERRPKDAVAISHGDDTLTWIVIGSTATSTRTLVLPTGQSPTSLMYYPVDMDYLYVGTTSQASASISTYVVGWSGAPVQAITPMTTLTMPGADSAELGPYDVYAYGAFGGPSVRDYTALAGLPFGSGTVVDLPSRPVSLLPGYVVEANGTVLAFDPYNAVPGTSVRVPLGPVVSSTTVVATRAARPVGWPVASACCLREAREARCSSTRACAASGAIRAFTAPASRRVLKALACPIAVSARALPPPCARRPPVKKGRYGRA